MNDWISICPLDDIPRLGARVVAHPQGDIAIFRTARDEIYALHDHCPHRGGPLSQGLVHGTTVTCPLHGWNIGLADGQAAAPDHGSCARFEVAVRDGNVYLKC